MAPTQPTRPKKYLNKTAMAQTAAETGEPESLVREVMDSVFAFTHSIISDGSFETVYLRTFGKFVPRMYMVPKIQEKRGRDEAQKAAKAILKQQKKTHETL